MRDLDIFAGKKMEVPLLFIAGTKDWLPYQVPGSLERVQKACDIFRVRNGLKALIIGFSKNSLRWSLRSYLTSCGRLTCNCGGRVIKRRWRIVSESYVTNL